MPYKIRKLPGKNLYRVTSESGSVKAKATTRTKALKQVRLLYALNNPTFKNIRSL